MIRNYEDGRQSFDPSENIFYKMIDFIYSAEQKILGNVVRVFSVKEATTQEQPHESELQ